MVLEVEAKNWYRDEYLVSTDPRLLQVDAINDALASDAMWWARGLPREDMKKALHNSLCLGLYVLPSSTAQIAGKSSDGWAWKLPFELMSLGRNSPTQIGLVRAITDGVTFAWLSDVYVLPEYQRKGLARWMLECLDQVIKGWPHLRRVMFLTTDMMDLYRETLGAMDWAEANQDKTGGSRVGFVNGAASQQPHHA
ncbi:hypothetical protein GGR56DRAFT_394912 [Xylariaceae sp. FL0804]|nr:hypothetical protein GGR56DRAFT_394912 [Xylariaceae sp. FL0804]